MKYLETVEQKIQQIKKYNGLELNLYSTVVKKKKGLIVFEVSMRTNFQNMELYKLEGLIKVGILSKTEISGHNRVTVYFA